MFERAGLLYMYFNYGMHWMANVTCQEEGVPSALLIRAARPITGINTIQTRRPRAKSIYDLLSGLRKARYWTWSQRFPLRNRPL